MTVEKVSAARCFKGTQFVYKHKSTSTNCEMTFGVYVPDHAESEKLPGLVYLSGLTCTHANVMEKAGAQRVASNTRMIFIHPDTSPRGEGVANADRYDLGQGAGFYVDATQSPWSDHFKMKSYVESELLSAVTSVVPALDTKKIGITGHSMGGHGAITLGLSRPDIFSSISAFAPISHPTNCDWGKLAFSTYLGPDAKEWEKFDAALLLKTYAGPARKILVDQGKDDGFYKEGQLQTESLVSTGTAQVTVNLREGYDHSYFFVATFIEEHFLHHFEQLAALR